MGVASKLEDDAERYLEGTRQRRRHNVFDKSLERASAASKLAPHIPVAQPPRIQRIVIIEATIGPDGKVQDAQAIKSIPIWDQAAVDAVQQWEFTPTLLDGEPVPVSMTVTVDVTTGDIGMRFDARSRAIPPPVKVNHVAPSFQRSTGHPEPVTTTQ